MLISQQVMEMEPIKVKELPIEYKIDKELLKLLSEANKNMESIKHI